MPLSQQRFMRFDDVTSVEVIERFKHGGEHREFTVRLRRGMWPTSAELSKKIATEYGILDDKGLPLDAHVGPMGGDVFVEFRISKGTNAGKMPDGLPSDGQGIQPRDPVLPPPDRAPKNWDHEKQRPIPRKGK